MIRCPDCECDYSTVVDSRRTSQFEAIRRRRECQKCGSRFTTYEIRPEDLHKIITRNNKRRVLDIVRRALDDAAETKTR